MWPVKMKGRVDVVIMNMNQTAKKVCLICGL
jgi:hypothetical protein